MTRTMNDATRKAIIALRQAEPAPPEKFGWDDALTLLVDFVVVGLLIASIIGMCVIAAASYYSGPVQ